MGPGYLGATQPPNPGQKEVPMIFRQFLTPKTGCASYLFG